MATVSKPSLSLRQAAAAWDRGQLERELSTSLEDGLQAADASRRAREQGDGQLKVDEPEPLWLKFLQQFKEPLVLLLLASAGVSLAVGQRDDACSIVLAVLIVCTVAFVQEYRSEKSLEALADLQVHYCTVVRNAGQLHKIVASELVVGDVVVVSVGDRIPADIRLLRCVDLHVDESILTGETLPISKGAAPLPGAAIERGVAERSNMAFMGSLVVQGHARGVVCGRGADTELGSISELVGAVERPKTGLQLAMEDLGKSISIFSLALIGVLSVAGWLQGRELLETLQVGVSLAVAAIPEGLPIVVTVTLALGMLRMSKKQAIVKRMPCVEALGSVTTLCCDKTGTLSQNQMTVVAVRVASVEASGFVAIRKISVSGSGYHAPGTFRDEVSGATIDAATDPQLCKLLVAGNVCNNGNLDERGLTGQPTEGALLALAQKAGLDDQRKILFRESEVPFSSETKCMSVACHADGAQDGTLHHFVKGAPEPVLRQCAHVLLPDGSTQPLSGSSSAALAEACSEMAAQSLRVLALACGESSASKEVTPAALVFCGLVGIVDPPRPGLSRVLGELAGAKVRVVMVTGDMQETAQAFGTQCGLLATSGGMSLSGHDIDKMDAASLQEVALRVSVFYRTTPAHKLRIVEALQGCGQVVAMTGDGVNDAPALKRADIGVGMGLSGTDVCREAADMVLMDDQLQTVVEAIKEGRCIFRNVTHFLRFQVTTGCAALMAIFLCRAAGMALPLNPMQILWINIIMDGPPAQSLGVEPTTSDVMRARPRDVKAPIVTASLLGAVVFCACWMVFGTMLVFLSANGENASGRRGTTMAFSTFVFFQMFHALNCRSATGSVLKLGRNMPFRWAIGLCSAAQLALVYAPFAQYIFETEPLAPGDLLAVLGMAATIVPLEEVRKQTPGPAACARVVAAASRRFLRKRAPLGLKCDSEDFHV